MLNLRPLACFLLLAPLAACAGSGGPARDGSAAPEIEVAGNHAFDATTLREVVRSIKCDTKHEIDAVIIKAPEGGAPHPCKSAEDVADSLKFFYLEHGYLGAEVRVSGGGQAGHLRLVVEEGELFRLGALEIVEADTRPVDPEVGDPQGLASSLPLRKGEPFSARRVRVALETLRSRYVAAGYTEANVMPLTSIGGGDFRIDLSFEIQRGPRRSTSP